MWKVIVTASLALIPGAAFGQVADDAMFGADGYRIAHYRSPVPAPPDGVSLITSEAVAQLTPDRDAILIDVYPAEGGHREDDGSWRLAIPRASLPGAHWFPEAGRGVLAPGIGPWFERGMAGLTGGDRSRRIVVFCLADCWMSWNAARRLRAVGYTSVAWFAEGTDGWQDMGLPLVDATPER
jgi:PQQ-dependent catabolism-associated CXXCW motif protein